jgi:hypothetical protein
MMASHLLLHNTQSYLERLGHEVQDEHAEAGQAEEEGPSYK